MNVISSLVCFCLLDVWPTTKVTRCVPATTVNLGKKIGVTVIAGEPSLTHSVMLIHKNVSAR